MWSTIRRTLSCFVLSLLAATRAQDDHLRRHRHRRRLHRHDLSSAPMIHHTNQTQERRYLQQTLAAIIEQRMTQFQLAKERYLSRLKQDYGPQNFEAFFIDDEPRFPLPHNITTRCTIGRNAFQKGSSNADRSWLKVVRKMKVNLLQSIIQNQPQDFVWATAGATDAAGHGNFFEEQYTMILQNRAADFFTSVGLNLVTRPYGHGGSTSAPEMAACAKEIYGTDIDLITWDFSMTDGRTHWRIEFFAHRVHMLPNHPVLLVLQPGDDPERKKLVEHMTDQGLTTLRQDDHYVFERKFQFPDCAKATPQELEAMTDHTRYFRCGYAFESGAACNKHKFTHDGRCDDRDDQTHWQHGWKWHAYHGNLYALFLMEILEDALFELKNEAGQDPRVLLERLINEENADFNLFEKEAEIMYAHKWVFSNITAWELYRDPTYCHTANLPAQTRYLGHVFNDHLNDNWFRFNHGLSLKTLRLNAQREMQLGYVPPGRNKTNICNVPTKLDSKDFFLATGKYGGYQVMTIPNDVEFEVYGPHKPRGIIALCATACTEQCGGTPLLSPASIQKDKASLRVNGELVEDIEDFENCHILAKKNGEIHWHANERGRYDIEVQVSIPGNFFRFTSFILW